MLFNSKFSKGMKVLLLKNKTAQLDRYEVLFRSSGFEPEFVPLITHTHVTADFFDLLREPGYLEGLKNIIITSQRTVECLCESVLPILDDQTRSKLLHKTVYTVGPVTKDFLIRIGFKEVRGGEDAGNGNLLAEIIIADLLNTTDDQKISEILFLVGEIRRDIIPKKLSYKGIKTKEVIMYRTKNLGDTLLRFQTAIEDNAWVVFFSPQGTDEILNSFNVEHHENIKIASIGPTTEEYLENNGIKPNVVSSKPDAESLLKAMQSYL